MSVVRWVVVLGALVCGCTQDFGKFLGDAGGGGDSGGGDAASDAPSCDVPQSCLSSVSTCGQSCVSGYNTCVGQCGTQNCKNQCKGQESTCQQICTTSCVSCADAGTCAQTICQGALP